MSNILANLQKLCLILAVLFLSLAVHEALRSEEEKHAGISSNIQCCQFPSVIIYDTRVFILIKKYQ